VVTDAGTSVLQTGQRPPLSDSSPPQFGQFITTVWPQVDPQNGSRFADYVAGVRNIKAQSGFLI